MAHRIAHKVAHVVVIARGLIHFSSMNSVQGQKNYSSDSAIISPLLVLCSLCQLKCHRSFPKMHLGRWYTPNRFYANQNCLLQNWVEMRFIQNYWTLWHYCKTQIQILVRSSVTIQLILTQGIRSQNSRIIFQNVCLPTDKKWTLSRVSRRGLTNKAKCLSPQGTCFTWHPTLRRRVFDCRLAAPRNTNSINVFSRFHLQPRFSISYGNLW